MGPQRKTSAQRHAVFSADYADFAVGDRVRVKEGLLGTVTAVEDGPYPGTEQYQVRLDDGMGGGTWGAGEVIAVGPTTAAGLSPQQEFANGVADTYEALGGESLTRYEAAGEHVASSDYPELTDILVSRPPLPHSEPLRMRASKDDRFAGVSLKQDDDGWYVTTHRARSDSYASPEEIPQSKVDFIESTGSKTAALNDAQRKVLLHAHNHSENQTSAATTDPDYAAIAKAQFPGVQGEIRRSTRKPNEVWFVYGSNSTGDRAAGYRFIRTTQKFSGQATSLTALERMDEAYPLVSKVSAAVDWDDVYSAYWCEACGFKGHLEPSTNGLDVCPQCGHAEKAVDIDGVPFQFGLAASLTPSADEHVLIATASLWDRVLDKGLDILNSQMDPEYQYQEGTSRTTDWCRFRKNERCLFPKTLNEKATEQAGYAVWNPEDRGLCPRQSWDMQKKCPVGEPGPNSGDPQSRVDATVAWEDGGQRLPEGWEISDEDYHRNASLAKTAFEFTASWSDVRNKAKRIRAEGGVRIISAPRPNDDNLTITAEVKGDNHTYETTLLREPGKRNVASWSCGCAWASYSWGRQGYWRKYEGRMCSHALAVQYEAQARGMNGRQIREDATAPAWRDNPFTYVKPPRAGEHGRAASLRPVCLDGDLFEAPALRIEREASLQAMAKVMVFHELKALVRGGIRMVRVVLGRDRAALIEGLGKVPLTEVLYPAWHPSLGLSLSHTAAVESHVVDGQDGAHVPGTDRHYPYDQIWADPSHWGLHGGLYAFGDDTFLFETDNRHEMEQGDPAGAASFGDAGAYAEATLHDAPEPALPTTEADDEADEVMQVAQTEALLVEAMTDPATAPEMAEAIGESLAASPPSPGDPRLAWLMSGSPDGTVSGAGGGSPQTASDGDIAAQAKAHLAKMALKEFSPAEQQEIINEGMDVLAANLADLDIKGTHYEGLEAALQQAEAAGDDEDGWLE